MPNGSSTKAPHRLPTRRHRVPSGPRLGGPAHAGAEDIEQHTAVGCGAHHRSRTACSMVNELVRHPLTSMRGRRARRDLAGGRVLRRTAATELCSWHQTPLLGSVVTRRRHPLVAFTPSTVESGACARDGNPASQGPHKDPCGDQLLSRARSRWSTSRERHPRLSSRGRDGFAPFLICHDQRPTGRNTAASLRNPLNRRESLPDVGRRESATLFAAK